MSFAYFSSSFLHYHTKKPHHSGHSVAFPALCLWPTYPLIYYSKRFTCTTNTDTLPRADTGKVKMQYFPLFSLVFHFTDAVLSRVRLLEITKGIWRLRVLNHPPTTCQKHLPSTSSGKQMDRKEGAISSDYTTWPLWLGGIYSVSQEPFVVVHLPKVSTEEEREFYLSVLWAMSAES